MSYCASRLDVVVSLVVRSYPGLSVRSPTMQMSAETPRKKKMTNSPSPMPATRSSALSMAGWCRHACIVNSCASVCRSRSALAARFASHQSATRFGSVGRHSQRIHI